MNPTKLILGIGLGAILSGIAFSVIGYFNTINDHSSTLLGPVSGWWRLAIITSAIAGAIIGGVSGAVIVGFQLNIFKSALFGLVLNLLIILLLATFGDGEKDLTFTYCASSLVGVVNGAVISLLSFWQQPLNQ